jgi:hypothetical protein
MSVNNVGDHRDQYCYCAILAGFSKIDTTLVKLVQPRVVLKNSKSPFSGHQKGPWPSPPP